MKLKQYPDYKKFDLPWIDRLPSGWDILRAKCLFKQIDVRSETGEEELLSVSEKQGVTPRKNVNVTMFKAESYKGYKLCWPGDLVINSLWAWMQGLGFSRYHGIISTAYGVYRIKNSYEAHYKYFDYLFRSAAYLWELRVRSKGIWRSRYQLTDDAFLTMPVIIPTEDEQKQIVRYLDFKSVKITKFIRSKRRLIKLLNEQKQAIINQTVTRGINSDVKMKQSGIDWVGDVPEHWEIQRLKYLVSINMKVLPENTDINYEFSYLDIGSVGTGYTVRKPEKMRFENAPSRARRIPKVGDTIISTVRTYLRAVLYFDQEIEDLICSTGFAVLTPNLKIEPALLGSLIQSDNFINLVIKESIGVSYPAIAETKLGALKIVYPPDRDEQKKLVETLKSKTKDIDEAIKKVQREIDLIQQYRTRLISDVVTGKVDVRDIKVEDVTDEEITDDLDLSEDEQELDDSVEEGLDEE